MTLIEYIVSDSVALIVGYQKTDCFEGSRNIISQTDLNGQVSQISHIQLSGIRCSFSAQLTGDAFSLHIRTI